ncbi:hypothetical protein Tco_1493455 [Tanacetum coccineum]
MSEPMPSIPTQSPFTYPNPNPSASPSFTQDDTSESFIPEPIQPMPTFTQTAFSQPAVNYQHDQPNQSIFSQPAVHFQQTQPTQTNQTNQTNQTGQQYPNNVQSQQFQQFQTATISANNAKFPYLEKEKYEIWAMKMEYWIQNADHNLWRIVQQGNSPKRLGKDAKGNTIVHPPVSLDEHVAVQRENKVRTLLLQALPEDHMPDFHHYDDARDIWMAVKARFYVTEEEGLHKGYDRFQKILSQLNQVQARPDNDDINLKFLRALPSSYGVKACCSHSFCFIGAASSGSKLTYSNQQSIVPSVSQTSGRSDNIMECVLHSFVAENEPDQDMIYEDFDQGKTSLVEVRKVLGMMALGLHADNGGAGVSDAGLLSLLFDGGDCSPKGISELLFKNLESQNDWHKRKKDGKLRFKEYFGEDEVFDLSRPSTMYPEPVEEEVKPLYSRFVKAGEMHAVPPSITGTYMPNPYKSDIEETQVSYGSKSDNKTSKTSSESKDFVSCDTVTSLQTQSLCILVIQTSRPRQRLPPAVDIKTFTRVLLLKTQIPMWQS